MSRGRSIILLMLLGLLGGGLRLARLSADAPVVFPNGLAESAPVKDEAAKGFAARNHALFGTFSPAATDDYRFWEILSPVWTGGLTAWFSAFGAGYPQARLFSVFWSIVSMLGLYWALGSRRAGLYAAGFFAVNFYAVMFGRLGLLETMLNALLILAFGCAARAGRKPALFGAAAGLWLAAWFVKQNAVVFWPALAVAAALLPRGARRLALLAAGAALLAAAAGFLFPDYRVRSIMNLRHALDYRPDPTYLWMQVDPARTREALLRNLTAGLVRGFWLMAPVAGPLAVARMVQAARGLRRAGQGRTEAVIASAWWISAFAVLAFQGQLAPRFHLILLPPTLILAALALDEAAARAGRLGRALPVGALTICAVLHLAPWAAWVEQNPREIERGAVELQKAVGPGPATLAGEWAGPLAFGTDYRYFYLKNVFNRTAPQVAALGLTHLLVQKGEEEGEGIDPAVRRLKKFFPSAWDGRREAGRMVLWPGQPRQAEIVIYQLPAQPWQPR